MGTIVAKFGGGATADAEALRRVGGILRAEPGRRCAVLSAPGRCGECGEKVTDLLESAWRMLDRGQDASEPLRRVVARFRAIAEGLDQPDPSAEVRRELSRAATASRDALLSRGECLCARLFARWMGWAFADAADVVRIDAAGAPDAPATAARLAAVPQPFVLPGFYGADGDGRIRAFPRNGSDITGALAAAALGAEVYENWTDVDGLMTADPAAVPDARPIPRLGFRQMRLLSEAGAKVLHPDCLAPVEAAGIPIHLRSALRPEAPGTWIDGRCDAIVPCVVGKYVEGRAVVTVFGAPPGAKARLIRALSGAPVAENGALCRFLGDAGRLDDDLRAAHAALFRA